MLKLAPLCLLALALVGCGDSNPVAPTPPPPVSIAGAWSGTWESANFTPRAVLIDITQTGGTINGTWVTSPDGWNGTLTGTVDAGSFSGSLTFNARSTTGSACTGNGAFSGMATAGSLRWTSPAITGNCTGLPTTNSLTLQRR